ncbi:hypothetical protein LTS08_001681 [Lithohypha guttulata]|uniref:uncharacterized protein n=1 Tax=Lithohypha guttulata TaxID=1690604 RepID=UPI002DE02ED6|nr:hypothetical protein LTR51_003636 [Lithohypha guttulata]KAK5105404.1 hypothetical protein LTS08_001681 [Lithohypha guttulata]
MDDSFESPPAKRQRLAYHHKHHIQHRQAGIPEEGALLPQDLLDKLVITSIKAICEEEARKQDIDQPVIESVALEALRNATDEFAHALLSKVQRFMLAARRTVPVAVDFDAAFYALNVPVPEDQLEKYPSTVEINRPLLPTPPPDDEFHHSFELPEHLLGPELSRQQDLRKFSFNTKALPPVPSAHTYRDTAVFDKRETDPKTIRERATEEGKLGEQALRKLAGALKADAVLSISPEARYIQDRRPRRLRREPVMTEEAMFEETMRNLLLDEPGFELGPVVSCEKQYRMPDEGRVRRRHVNMTVLPATQKQPESGGDPSKYNLLPPPLRKQKPAADDMDIAFEI